MQHANKVDVVNHQVEGHIDVASPAVIRRHAKSPQFARRVLHSGSRSSRQTNDRRIEALDVAHHQTYPGLCRHVDHPHGFLFGRGNGFFYEHMHSSADKMLHHFRVKSRWGRHAHRVNVRRQIAIILASDDVPKPSRLFTLLWVGCRHPRQTHPRQSQVRLGVPPAHASEANHTHPQFGQCTSPRLDDTRTRLQAPPSRREICRAGRGCGRFARFRG